MSVARLAYVRRRVDNFLPLKDDERFVFHNLIASDDLGDGSRLLDLSLLPPGGQPGLLESARIVLIHMTFFVEAHR
ncbi:unnamed protein product [Prunus brigantina]